MVLTSLFKVETGAESFTDQYDADTQIIWFWVHQPRRLTDGHIAIARNGRARVVVNMTTLGGVGEIAARAKHDEFMWRNEVGLTEWSDAELAQVLDALGVATPGSPVDAFAEMLKSPIREAERALNTPRLCIRWDIDGRNPMAADMPRQALKRAEAVLNDAGLLVDSDGCLVDENRVQTTFTVRQFDAAKAVVLDSLSAEERGCNIAELSNGA